eukprot:TRINITY_DN11784_c0_g4_i1.p1 TRINITY_DN11784_c0_g4~~TRINITY_DN11784_c0_g4_i1.p1  ORF type:complete len:549 (+),score=84.93 TRINITY_DN11784_c0_g4_i1:55-1647(+)
MGRKKVDVGGTTRAAQESLDLRPFCYYCDKEFATVKELIQHQRTKHFNCAECGLKFDTITGLRVHMLNAYKKTMKEVPGAIQGRENPDIVVHGMEGLPKSIVEERTQKALAEQADRNREKAERAAARAAERGAEPPPPPPGRKAKRESSPSSKRRRVDDPSENFSVWDQAFYTDLIKREELSLDDETLKEFFPLEATIERLLRIYSELLGLDFVRSSSLPVWHEDVVAFEVKRQDSVVGHLYLDQFPRDGKFGHQMIIPLSPSYVDDKTGQRCVPACANISNLPRPQDGKPALLRFAEMRTLFHELGHAVHCLCTTTQYSILSWAWPMVPWPGGVEQDFLEVPSMALEKFASEPMLLRRVAAHFSGQDEPRLSDDTIERIQSLDKFMVGTSQSKYFAMALFDIILHSQASPYVFGGQKYSSIEELFRACLESHTTLAQIPGTHPCASWYHLVIGYDAGYYGYGWSDVYAADVFECLLQSPSGALSSEAGGRLRDAILGPCASRAGADMLRDFLGREPTADAWCRRNGVPS